MCTEPLNHTPGDVIVTIRGGRPAGGLRVRKSSPDGRVNSKKGAQSSLVDGSAGDGWERVGGASWVEARMMTTHDLYAIYLVAYDEASHFRSGSLPAAPAGLASRLRRMLSVERTIEELARHDATNGTPSARGPPSSGRSPTEPGCSREWPRARGTRMTGRTHR